MSMTTEQKHEELRKLGYMMSDSRNKADLDADDIAVRNALIAAIDSLDGATVDILSHGFPEFELRYDIAQLALIQRITEAIQKELAP